ncbi:hypothetical protein ACFQV2_24020 [Actinokineospora soli]|uniref:AAA domain-containing protein n=1 Tax=Actinokineospora soli TaxID=1048753 RepID=A0ABW2TT50_9PSEU
MRELLRGRLAVVVAAAGYGKTTAVRRWLREAGERAVVVDDVHPDRLPDPPGAPDRLVLISREPIPVSALLRYDLGAPVEIGPRQLALSARRTAALLASQHGVTDPEAAAAVHELTAGWPALALLAGAHAAEPADVLSRPGTPLHDYIAAEVLGPSPTTPSTCSPT